MLKKVIKKHSVKLLGWFFGSLSVLWMIFGILTHFAKDFMERINLTLLNFFLISIIITLFLLVCDLSNAQNTGSSNEKTEGKTSTIRVPQDQALESMNTEFNDKDFEYLDVVGYSVHSILDEIHLLFRKALINNFRVRILFLSPQSEFLFDKANIEQISQNMSLPELTARNKDNIARTSAEIDTKAHQIQYQKNLLNLNYSIRVYNAPPIYRGVITKLGASVSSYLDDFSKPGREFEMTLPIPNITEIEIETQRAREYFNYLWKYRSRPMKTSAIIFDLYDTIVKVDRVAREIHNREISLIIGVDVNAFTNGWQYTSQDSNLGNIASTYERFKKILELVGKPFDSDMCEKLSKLEHEYLKSNTKLDDLMKKFLVQLRNRGYKIGLLTNCSVSVLSTISSTDLTKYFDTIVFSFEIGMLKPQEASYTCVLNKLGVSAEETVFIGDGENSELSTATNLGMRTIKANWYFDNTLPGVYTSANTILDVAKWIDPESDWVL
jgi:putative hydrolase of the HAD superfamily